MKFIGKLLSRNSYKEKNTTAVSIGALGEEAAVKALRKNGYKILERNFRTKTGEIDIIAKDKEYTCFVEVKLRKTNCFGSPADAINEQKRRRIISAAKYYAVKNGLYESPLRFDAVLINAEAKGERLINTQIEIIKDAFRLQENI